MLPAPPVPPVDPYVLDVLMPDLIGHDKRPSAFVVYLALWRRIPSDTNATVRLSHQALTSITGLSRSAVQTGLDHLRRRGLVQTARTTPTSVPAHTVHRPWLRRTGRTR
jgi:hypothetical protein